MSNVIPPLLSDSPPPIPDDEEDEFGDFNSAIETSYAYENLSLPSTPQHKPLGDISRIENFDINSNTNNIKDVEYKNHINGLFSMHGHKDFQEKRSCDITPELTNTDVNLPKSQEDTVNNVNTYKVSAFSYGDNPEEIVGDSQEINDGVSPNESVPIDISTHNHLSVTSIESNIVPDTSGESSLKNKDTTCPKTCEDVPCSNDVLLDNLKNNSNEDSCSALSSEPKLQCTGSDKNTSESNVDLNIVPNECSAENVTIEEVQELKDGFYFIEEPPDLHVIDDSKVQVEDFRYYDAYDDHENHKLSQEECHKTISNYSDLSIINQDIAPAENSIEHIPSDDNSKIDKNLDINDRKNELNPSLNENGNELGKTSENKSISENFTELLVSSENSNDIQFHIVNDTSKSSIDIVENNLNEDASTEINIITTETNQTVATSTTTKELEDNIDKVDNNSCDEDDLKSKKVDDFNDFHVTCNEDSIRELNDENHSKQDEVDSFCSFSSFKEETSIETAVNESRTALLQEDDPGDFDDFAQFENVKFSENTAANYTEDTSSTQTKLPDTSNGEDDEFGDFGDYTQSGFPDNRASQLTTISSIPKINKEKILENAEKIILDMYPACEVSCDEFVLVDALETDSVFKNVKDVTETNALMYQWTKSTSQDKLLNALNIDTRNILYGPGWNPMMPKYAANLGVTPLEPVKSTDVTLTPTIQNCNPNTPDPSPSPTAPLDIPRAQFDWNGSGLINPLDCQSKDNPQTTDQELNLDQLEKNTDTLTPVLRARFHSDNESVKSLQLTSDTLQDPEETSNKPETTTATYENDFDEFTSYQSQKPIEYSQWSTTHVPLRETRISTERISEESPIEGARAKNADDEFTDFQTSLPNPKSSTSDFNVFNSGGSILQPLKPIVVAQTTQESTQINWPNPGITDEDILNIELAYSAKDTLSLEENIFKGKKTKELSVTPSVREVSRKTPQKALDVNFPDLVQVTRHGNIQNTRSDNHKAYVTTPIGLWSAPKSSQPSSSVKIGKPDDDDDDWSDFVCNPEPMRPTIYPKTTPALSDKQAPELRLSVPRLSQLQQPKKPIPVITPQGLIQTRIPSNISNLANLNVQQPSSLFQNQVKDTFQPSIISHQYQNHMNCPPFNKVNVNGFYNGLVPQQINQSLPNANVGNKSNNEDDDDWTDFISSAPVQTSKKSVTISTGNVVPRTNTPNSGNIAMPNIITNPVHFDYNSQRNKNNFGGNARNARRSTNNVNLGGPVSIPSISALPDLDFIAPKSRTFTRK